MKESKVDCILRLTIDGQQQREHYGLAHVVEVSYDARFQIGYGHVSLPSVNGDWRRITDELVSCSDARLNLEDGRTARIKAVRTRYEWSYDSPTFFGFYFVSLGPFALVVRSGPRIPEHRHPEHLIPDHLCAEPESAEPLSGELRGEPIEPSKPGDPPSTTHRNDSPPPPPPPPVPPTE